MYYIESRSPHGKGQFLEKCMVAQCNVKGEFTLVMWLFPNYFGISHDDDDDDDDDDYYYYY